MLPHLLTIVLAIAAFSHAASATCDPCESFDLCPGEEGVLCDEADVIFLRRSCTDYPAHRCVPDDPGDPDDGLEKLLDWIATDRIPLAANPLMVDIGPGDFAGILGCSSGYVLTFRGAGPDATRIVASASEANAYIGFDCARAGVENLTLVSTAHPQGNGVAWFGGGESYWRDVEIEAAQHGWFDNFCFGSATDPPAGTHRFDSVHWVTRATAVTTECSALRFHGSDLVVKPAGNDAGFAGTFAGAWINRRADVRLYATTLRVIADALTTFPAEIFGARVGVAHSGLAAGHGDFHMHGGTLRVAAASVNRVVAIELDDAAGTGDASSFTPGVSFFIDQAPNVERLAGQGVFTDPYLWESAPDPPLSNLSSVDGMDVFVESGCRATDCDSGNDPHLMIYHAACAVSGDGPWWDVVRNDCRD